jgi:hypothetical protein
MALNRFHQTRLIKAILSAVGMTLANLDGAQITFNALLLQHPFSTKADLISRISKHYYVQALREASRINDISYVWEALQSSRCI